MKLPSAREVRDVLGQVEVGGCLVSYKNDWGDERFPWRVCGPEGADGMRPILEEFPAYREAVRFAKKVNREREKAASRAPQAHGRIS